MQGCCITTASRRTTRRITQSRTARQSSGDPDAHERGCPTQTQPLSQESSDAACTLMRARRRPAHGRIHEKEYSVYAEPCESTRRNGARFAAQRCVRHATRRMITSARGVLTSQAHGSYHQFQRDHRHQVAPTADGSCQGIQPDAQSAVLRYVQGATPAGRRRADSATAGPAPLRGRQSSQERKYHQQGRHQPRQHAVVTAEAAFQRTREGVKGAEASCAPIVIQQGQTPATHAETWNRHRRPDAPGVLIAADLIQHFPDAVDIARRISARTVNTNRPIRVWNARGSRSKDGAA